MIREEPTHTIVCVRIPADDHFFLALSTPTTAPNNAAASKRVNISVHEIIIEMNSIIAKNRAGLFYGNHML